MDIDINTNAPIPKLACLYDREFLLPYEYILLHGGRGGGKTEELARWLVINSFSDSGYILCTREIQKSIADSVYSVIERWIDDMGVRKHFHIIQGEITNKLTGAKFMFKGMKAGIDNDTLKGLDKVKYVWFEEAQSMTPKAWEKLDPTIRRDDRKLFFSFNPDTPQDTVNKVRDHGDCVLDIEINYYDNPYCPEVLKRQAEIMKELYPELYKHVWEGQPASMSDAYTVLPYNMLRRCIDAHKKIGNAGGHPYGGLDLAPGEEEKHDKNAITTIKGPVVLWSDHWHCSDLDKIADRVINVGQCNNIVRLFFDAVGVGGFANGTLRKRKPRFRLEPHMGGSAVMGKERAFLQNGSNIVTNGDFFKNAKAQMWWNLRLRMENTIKLLNGKEEEVRDKTNYLSFDSGNPHLEQLLIELSQATYSEDSAGRVIIDKAPGDKEIIMPDGKKKKVRSPNIADSCGLAFLRSCNNGLRAN